MMLPSAVIELTQQLMTETRPKIEHRQGVLIIQQLRTLDPKKGLSFQELKEGPLANLPPHIQQRYRDSCNRQPSGASAPELTSTGSGRR